MIAKLEVYSAEDRQFMSKKGPGSAKRLVCLDSERTLTHMIQVSVPVESLVKPGDRIDLKVTHIRQWQDGSVLLSGEVLNGSVAAKK